MLITTFLMGAILALPAESAPHQMRASRVAPVPAPVTSAGLKALILESGTRYTLVNLWASWCMPCREEFPELLKARQELRSRGFRLMLVSTDFKASLPQARAFLGERGVDFATWQKNERDQAFIAGLSANWSGLLPASILFDSEGKVLRTWEGGISYDFIASELDALDKEYDTP